VLTHSKLGMITLAILESGWWEKSLAIQLVTVWVIRNSHNPQISCALYGSGKFILRPSPLKIQAEPLKFLERIQGDICGPIQPLSGPFRYFMVLIDASTRWSHVCLLSTWNHAFAKLIAQVIWLRASKPEHRIKSIRMDNAGWILFESLQWLL
jgi:hypothetical protein